MSWSRAHRTRRAIVDVVLDTAELCDRLRVHENTVATWRKEGLPNHPAGNALLYRWNEVAAWLERNDREGYVMRADALSMLQSGSSPERPNLGEGKERRDRNPFRHGVH